MKKFCCIAMLLMICLVTGCKDTRAEVEAYNAGVESTINLYEGTRAIAIDNEQILIEGIEKGKISLPCADTLDFSEATLLMQQNEDPLIEKLAVINSSTFYTRLGQNSVTQIVDFLWQGTRYTLELLWVDCKIDQLLLEVSK